MKREKIYLASMFALLGVLMAPTAMAQLSLGPDGGDHILTDELNQALYDYVDISTTGQVVVTGDDQVGNFTFANSRSFNFYGANRTAFRANTNGLLSTDLADAVDVDNDCAWPTWPIAPSVGGGNRIYALHDDLVTTVYYQYFDENNPPGAWVGDVSVVQWKGTYFSGGSVDFEILFFHRLNVAVLMYEVVDQTGSSSTTAIINSAATTGLLYDCGLAGTVNPGLLLSLGTLKLNEIRTDQPGAGDPDEYFELTGAPGFDLTGLTLVVLGDVGNDSGVIEEAIDLTDVTFDPGGVGATLTSVGKTGTTIGVDWVGPIDFENTDNLTFLLVDEFTGVDGTDLDIDDDGSLDSTPWSRVVDEVAILDDTNFNPAGGVEFPYTAISVGPAGNAAPFHVQRCGDHTGPWVIGDPDPANGLDTPSSLNNCQQCGNGLVEGTEACDGDGAGNGGETATCNDDCTVAACGDGNVNAAAGETCDDGDLDNEDDCPDDGANGGTCVPAACGDGFVDAEGAQTEGCDDGNGSNADDCPDDAANGGTCEPATCGDGFTNTNGTVTEDCDDAGESATCDADCSDATCGDMTINNTAGETCDDGARTATCDSDCTAVSCGDGIVNATNGEMCDGDGAGNGGETATCDTDCTAAECGDGEVNAAAGEDCDDTDESLTCDDDCTDVACGDGTLNVTAGEECDDGNTSPGDGCDANCAEEMGMGGMGGMGAGGMAAGGMGPGVGGGGPGVGGGGPGAGGSSSNGSGGSDNDDDTVADEGCSCTAPGHDAPNGAASLALLLGAGVMMRRRRRAA